MKDLMENFEYELSNVAALFAQGCTGVDDNQVIDSELGEVYYDKKAESIVWQGCIFLVDFYDKISYKSPSMEYTYPLKITILDIRPVENGTEMEIRVELQIFNLAYILLSDRPKLNLKF